MHSRLRFHVTLFLTLCCLGGPWPAVSATSSMPDWLVGDWTPVDIRQDADTLYPSEGNEPKHWLANQHLKIAADSLTLWDDRCQAPTLSVHHGPPSLPIRETGSGTLESLGLPTDDKPIDYISFKCAHDLLKSNNKQEFTTADDRTIEVTWYVIVHSHTEIDLPFYGGSYLKFKKTPIT